MTHTVLLEEILERANRVKEEFGGEYLCSSHIAVAVTDFCRTKYTGFSLSDMTYLPSRFEEERLRYLFAKETKMANYFRMRLSHNRKNGTPEEAFDLSGCERIAALRKAQALSSDVVFLCALASIHESYRKAVQTVHSEEAVLLRLEDADENVYDYVIEQLRQICSALKEKADEARSIRDWKPAAKFAEPEQLVQQLFAGISAFSENNILHITVPGFLRGSDLELSIYKVQDHFAVHDNGCAVKSLSTRIDDTRIQKALTLLWDASNLQGSKLFTQVAEARYVLYFIQEVILTANADLYYEYFKEETFGRRRYIEPCRSFEDRQQAEAFDTDAFLSALKETVTASYDESKGITLRLDTKYCNCSYGIRVLIETLGDGTVRFSDGFKNKQYETGEMLEAFYFGSDKQDEDMYYARIRELAEPFGMKIDMTCGILFPEYNGRKHNQKNPYMLSSSDNWISDLYRFINSAVLISVVADRIHYEKLREW